MPIADSELEHKTKFWKKKKVFSAFFLKKYRCLHLNAPEKLQKDKKGNTLGNTNSQVLPAN